MMLRSMSRPIHTSKFYFALSHESYKIPSHIYQISIPRFITGFTGVDEYILYQNEMQYFIVSS